MVQKYTSRSPAAKCAVAFGMKWRDFVTNASFPVACLAQSAWAHLRSDVAGRRHAIHALEDTDKIARLLETAGARHLPHRQRGRRGEQVSGVLHLQRRDIVLGGLVGSGPHTAAQRGRSDVKTRGNAGHIGLPRLHSVGHGIGHALQDVCIRRHSGRCLRRHFALRGDCSSMGRTALTTLRLRRGWSRCRRLGYGQGLAQGVNAPTAPHPRGESQQCQQSQQPANPQPARPPQAFVLVL